MARIDRDSPKVRLAFVVTAANAAQILGIAVVAGAGVLVNHDSFRLFAVASLVGYIAYLVVGIRALRQVVDPNWYRVARNAMIVAPLVAFALWMPLNDYVPFIEWTPLVFPYLFVLGSVAYKERNSDPSSGNRFR